MEGHEQSYSGEYLQVSGVDTGFHVELDVSASRALGNIIKVIAIGGAGGNAGNYVYTKGLPFVEVAAYNTDLQDLNKLKIAQKHVIGEKETAQMGAGREPTLGRGAMLESIDKLESFLPDLGQEEVKRSHFAFLLGGLGGGTASGALPVAAEKTKERGYITIAVVTLPPRHVGRVAMEIALESLEKMEKVVDKVVLIDNENIYRKLSQEKKSDAYQIVDAKIADSIESFVNIISRVPRENVDPNDIRTVLTSTDSKLVVIGTGVANREVESSSEGSTGGKLRVISACDNAINSPILLYNSILGADTFLLHTVTHPEDGLAAFEERVLAEHLRRRSQMPNEPLGNSFSILSGGGDDESIERGAVQVTLIATGFKLLPSEVVKRFLKAEVQYEEASNELDFKYTDDELRIIELQVGNNPSGSPIPVIEPESPASTIKLDLSAPIVANPVSSHPPVGKEGEFTLDPLPGRIIGGPTIEIRGTESRAAREQQKSTVYAPVSPNLPCNIFEQVEKADRLVESKELEEVEKEAQKEELQQLAEEPKKAQSYRERMDRIRAGLRGIGMA